MNNTLTLPQLESEFLSTASQVESNHSICEIKYLSPHLETTDSGYNEISFSVKSKVVNLQTFRTSSKMARDMQADIMNLHGVDASSLVTNVLINEDLRNAERELKQKYTNFGKKTYESFVMNRWRSLVSSFFKKLEYPVFVKDSSQLFRKVIKFSNFIGIKTREGGANFMIVNVKLKELLYDCESFVIETKNYDPSTIHFIGYLAPGIKVFLDPTQPYDDTTVVIGSTTKTDSRGVYLIKGPREIDEVTGMEMDGSSAIHLEARRCITETPHSEEKYLTFKVVHGKTPLWRKLLGL